MYMYVYVAIAPYNGSGVDSGPHYSLSQARGEMEVRGQVRLEACRVGKETRQRNHI